MFADEKDDAGIQTMKESEFDWISARSIQYQAKYEKEVECGGGGPPIDDAKAFGDPTVYNIKFGPDKCGYNTRAHLIDMFIIRVGHR